MNTAREDMLRVLAGTGAKAEVDDAEAKLEEADRAANEAMKAFAEAGRLLAACEGAGKAVAEMVRLAEGWK